jgi:hypothetical protein
LDPHVQSVPSDFKATVWEAPAKILVDAACRGSGKTRMINRSKNGMAKLNLRIPPITHVPDIIIHSRSNLNLVTKSPFAKGDLGRFEHGYGFKFPLVPLLRKGRIDLRTRSE